MVFKTINNTAGFNGWVPILLVFKAYLYMNSINLLMASIIQKAVAIDKTINEV